MWVDVCFVLMRDINVSHLCLLRVMYLQNHVFSTEDLVIILCPPFSKQRFTLLRCDLIILAPWYPTSPSLQEQAATLSLTHTATYTYSYRAAAEGFKKGLWDFFHFDFSVYMCLALGESVCGVCVSECTWETSWEGERKRNRGGKGEGAWIMHVH